jgi:hypothetical protein
MTDLTRRENGIKGLHSVHAQVRDAEVPAVELVGLELLASRSLDEVRPVPSADQ